MASTVWRGYISFGLISIPVRLYRAARAERISFRRVTKQAPSAGSRATDNDEDEPESDTRHSPSIAVTVPADRQPLSVSFAPNAEVKAAFQAPPAEPMPEEAPITRVRQASVRDDTDEVISPKSILKGYEYEKNRDVVIDPDELKSAAPKTSASMDIQEFVQLSEIDPVYFETSYYLTPEQAGEKAYALLYRSLQQTGLVAIAQFAMHSREHAVVVRPGKTGLLAHTMFYASEVRADEEYRADVSVVTAKELELAQMLVHSLAAPFGPEKYHDTYRERVQALVDKKMQGLPTGTEPVRPALQTNVIDIADALRRSLAELKKPVASDTPRESSAEKKPRSKRAGSNRG